MSTNQRPDRNQFITTIDGKKTDLFCIKNKNGLEFYISNYGATLVAAFVPDQNKKFEDIILGFDSIQDYQKRNSPFFGSTVGPFANRIANATFKLNDQQYELEKNHGLHSLHSGSTGLHQKVWDLESVADNKIVLLAFAECGEGGFPGNRNFQVSYSLNDNNQLRIDFQIHSDKDSIFNPTNHSYFNLSGQLNSKINNHQISIDSDHIIAVNHENIPTGKLTNTENSIFDLKQMLSFGESHKNENLTDSNGYDHCYVLNENSSAILQEPNSGRRLEVSTDMPGIQLYTANFLNDIVGKNNLRYPDHSAVCLEAQYFPDTPNHDNFPSVRIKANKSKMHFITYSFGLVSGSI